MPKKPGKKYVAKRVSLLEIGAGHKPTGIVLQALHALRERVGRSFIASDIVASKEATLRNLGISDIPSNAKILTECSIKTLKEIDPKSQDIVFSSYFLNGYIRQQRISGPKNVYGAFKEFIELSKRALKDNGRIVIVGDLMNMHALKMVGRELGLKAYTRRLTNIEILGSNSEWVGKMSTKKGREDMINEGISNGDYTSSQATKFAQILKLKNRDELLYPSVIILRK